MTDPTTADTGTFVEHDGRPAVRFARTYPHPAATVWAAVSDPEHLAHWFPSAMTIEPSVGGTVTFGGDPNMADSTGTVLAWDPPHRVAFTWGGDEVHLSVEPVSASQATLVLVNVLEADDTAARNAAGWTVCMAELDKHLAGEPAAGPHGDAATPWRPIYDAYVASGMPAGAPVPGM
jgi:uncharacterized protein YndB with AHSA1/START domain